LDDLFGTVLSSSNTGLDRFVCSEANQNQNESFIEMKDVPSQETSNESVSSSIGINNQTLVKKFNIEEPKV
jgi:hypothetical protein